MTSPTVNSVGVTFFNPASIGAGRYVAHGEKWGGALGTGVTLTFSFLNHGTSYYAPNYSRYNEHRSSSELSNGEQAAVRAALAAWSSFANVGFRQVSDSYNTAGDLRFGYTTSNSGGEAAHAYFPSSAPIGGDVWFDWDNFNPTGLSTIARGSDDFQTILHEIGHALGLKHSFQSPNAIAAAQDNFFYSVMSYTASPWSAHGDNYASFYPTTPMYYDLLAIEAMYGRRAYNTGNNIYTFNDGVKYWQALHDTAGTDLIVYNGAENITINLNQGTFSTLSEAIAFRRPGGAAVFSKATVTIGPGVVIESARGGNGSDTLIGTNTANSLSGMAGNDSLNGAGGNDTLSGYIGNDTLRGGLGNDKLYGGANNDYFVFNTRPNSSTNFDTIMDYSAPQDQIHLENAIFTRLGSAGLLSSAFFRPYYRALDSNDFIMYDRASGRLSYDSDGSGAGAIVLIAVLYNKPVLTSSEFSVI